MRNENEGFRELLEGCTSKLGAYDEPPETDLPAVDVEYTDGSASSHDAVGVTEEEGEVILITFDWMQLSVGKYRDTLSDMGIPDEEIDHAAENTPEDPVLMVRDFIPWREVRRYSTGRGVVGLFELVREQ